MDRLPQVIPTTNVGNVFKRIIQHAGSNTIGKSSDISVTKDSFGTTIRLNASLRNFPTAFNNYRGEWDPDGGYYLNDIVRVLPETNYVADAGLGDLVNATPGVWICVACVPDFQISKKLKVLGWAGPSEYVRDTDARYEPFWPEPDDVATTEAPTGRYWELLSLLPVLNQTCVDGVQTDTWVDAYESGSAA